MTEVDKGISKEEFAQYDRQIRLWGLEAQKRLRKAKVLVIGIGGLGSELIKNIVLAGVDSITLRDSELVTEEDLFSQLLITPKDVGKNIAEASKPRTQELNPNVKVLVDTSPINLDEFNDDYVKQFDVICCTRVNSSTRVALNSVCRKNNVGFFCGDVYGFYGFSFTDLNHHDYIEEVAAKKVETNAKNNEPSNKKAKLEEGETMNVKKSLSFCSYADSLLEDWSKRSKRSLRQSSQVFFVIQILDKFREKFGRHPKIDADDSADLDLIKNEILANFKVKETFVKDDFANFCCSIFAPVSAIVGGVLGQEVIKAISKKDCPHLNYFFFDGTSHTGIVDHISPKQ